MTQLLESPNDPILQKDLISIVNNGDVPLDVLSNSTILVTGATGLVGSLIVKTIACCNRTKNTNIKVLAFVRNKEKAKNIFGEVLGRPEINLILGNINEKIKIKDSIDYIIHGAGPTASKYFVTNPVETIKTTLHGTENILELAKEKHVKSMVYLSSMEVYGQNRTGQKCLSEEDLGYIDILDVRSSYSEGKRMAECLCVSYASEYSVPVKIARLSRVFGPGFVDYNDDRILMQFARSVIEHKNITLHTGGETIINFCYLSDSIKALFLLLNKGKVGNAYNINYSNDNYTVKEVAEMLIHDYPESQMHLIFDIPKNIQKYGYNKITTHTLNNNRIVSLGSTINTNIKIAFKNLIGSLTNNLK